jgi:hypothetical protein
MANKSSVCFKDRNMTQNASFSLCAVHSAVTNYQHNKIIGSFKPGVNVTHVSVTEQWASSSAVTSNKQRRMALTRNIKYQLRNAGRTTALLGWLVGCLFYDAFPLTRLYSVDDRVI